MGHENIPKRKNPEARPFDEALEHLEEDLYKPNPDDKQPEEQQKKEKPLVDDFGFAS